MANDVEIAIVSCHLEIPVIRSQPAVENLDNVDPAIVDNQRARRFLAAVTGVTFHAERHPKIMAMNDG